MEIILPKRDTKHISKQQNHPKTYRNAHNVIENERMERMNASSYSYLLYYAGEECLDCCSFFFLCIQKVNSVVFIRICEILLHFKDSYIVVLMLLLVLLVDDVECIALLK